MFSLLTGFYTYCFHGQRVSVQSYDRFFQYFCQNHKKSHLERGSERLTQNAIKLTPLLRTETILWTAQIWACVKRDFWRLFNIFSGHTTLALVCFFDFKNRRNQNPPRKEASNERPCYNRKLSLVLIAQLFSNPRILKHSKVLDYMVVQLRWSKWYKLDETK